LALSNNFVHRLTFFKTPRIFTAPGSITSRSTGQATSGAACLPYAGAPVPVN